MWLSTVLILTLSVYSIRSIIFVYRVTRAKRNGLDKKILHENWLALYQRAGNFQGYGHFERSLLDTSENILRQTNANTQPSDEIRDRIQQDNSNSASNGHPYPRKKEDDKLLEKNKKTEGVDNMPRVAEIIPSASCTAISLGEQRVIVEVHSSIEEEEEVPARTANQRIDNEYPFISVLVATYNEALVIERLLKSFAALSYPTDRFEIIIVDDSVDDTYQKIQSMLTNFRNLKVIHRDNRTGWKGGALNVGINAMDKRASKVLVVDADNILVEDTLERFASQFIENQSFYNKKQIPILAIQGFPISKSNPAADDEGGIKENQGNWISRAIDFRLSQRNMIEFAAKELLNLPVQITGSLFMIRADVLKSIKFSNDLCEDWDLTIDLYCPKQASSSSAAADVEVQGNSNYNKRISHQPTNSILFSQPAEVSSRPKIIFDKELVSYCEATTALAAYFRQRMRVGEGHTRGLRKRIRQIAGSKMLSLVDKVELFLNGLQYTKYIFVLGIEIINAILILMFLSGTYSSQELTNVFGISFSLQVANLTAALVRIICGVRICRPIRRYGIKDILSLVVLTVVTTPAFVIGSLRGLLRDGGIFYRTYRNLPREPKRAQSAMFSDSSSTSSSSTDTTPQVS